MALFYVRCFFFGLHYSSRMTEVEKISCAFCGTDRATGKEESSERGCAKLTTLASRSSNRCRKLCFSHGTRFSGFMCDGHCAISSLGGFLFESSSSLHVFVLLSQFAVRVMTVYSSEVGGDHFLSVPLRRSRVPGLVSVVVESDMETILHQAIQSRLAAGLG
jgi:hypothetical protein